MNLRRFSQFVASKPPSIRLQTFQDLSGCSTRCTSPNNEFGEIVVTHGAINSAQDLYQEMKKQDSLLKQSILLIRFQNVLPDRASALVVILDFSARNNGKHKHDSIYDMASDVLRSHCPYIFDDRPSKRIT